MLYASFSDFELHFKNPARTSRGVMLSKKGYLLKVCSPTPAAESPQPDEVFHNTEICGIGECSPLEGLSFDDKPGYKEKLEELCADINLPLNKLLVKYAEWPSILFGLESALLDLANGGKGILFESDFTKGLRPIPINGLVWMGNFDSMLSQIDDKIAQGFKVIKIKVGAIDFDAETDLLRHIRKHHPPKEITIRLDANGSFHPEDALRKLEILSAFTIHSIEQPIKAGNPEKMRWLCNNSPIPIALDEELIGIHSEGKRLELLNSVRPQYIILKPSLIGGFTATDNWINLCKQLGIGFWITSALESNIGLNAIAQYTATLETNGLAQGLGTGGLFMNNFPSKLTIRNGELWSIFASKS